MLLLTLFIEQGRIEMEALIITIPVSLLLASFFVYLFIWSAKNGQMDNVEGNKNIIFDKLQRKKDE